MFGIRILLSDPRLVQDDALARALAQSLETTQAHLEEEAATEAAITASLMSVEQDSGMRALTEVEAEAATAAALAASLKRPADQDSAPTVRPDDAESESEQKKEESEKGL